MGNESMGLGNSGCRFGLENAVHHILERLGGQKVESDAGRHHRHGQNRVAFIGTEVAERAEIAGHTYLLARTRMPLRKASMMSGHPAPRERLRKSGVTDEVRRRPLSGTRQNATFYLAVRKQFNRFRGLEWSLAGHERH